MGSQKNNPGVHPSHCIGYWFCSAESPALLHETEKEIWAYKNSVMQYENYPRSGVIWLLSVIAAIQWNKTIQVSSDL